MKRIVILLLISLLQMTVTFSQNISYPRQTSDSIIEITANQLKQTNLIFIEHKSLKSENKELNFQVNKYKDLVNNYELQDSINRIKIKELSNYSEFANKQLTIKDKEITRLKKVKNNYKVFTICGISVSALLGILLFCK